MLPNDLLSILLSSFKWWGLPMGGYLITYYYYFKGAFTYDVRWFLSIFDLLTYPHQMLYYISLFSKIRWGLTYLPTQKSDVIYECSLIKTYTFINFWEICHLCTRLNGPTRLFGRLEYPMSKLKITLTQQKIRFNRLSMLLHDNCHWSLLFYLFGLRIS